MPLKDELRGRNDNQKGLLETRDPQREQHGLEHLTPASPCRVPAEKLAAVWGHQGKVVGRGEMRRNRRTGCFEQADKA